MNTREDAKWQSLLECSKPTFTGEAEPPYGFITSTLTQLRSEQRQVAEIERIGWRALLASFGALAVAAVIAFSVSSSRGSDFEPGTAVWFRWKIFRSREILVSLQPCPCVRLVKSSPNSWPSFSSAPWQEDL